MKNSTTLLALALFGLTGCGAADADGDGFDSTIDCNDDEVAIYPGAVEHCDGVDNDCNDVVDDNYAEEATVFFIDADGDGFGTPAASQTACIDVPPVGYVADASDCDDDDREVNPGAVELCNLTDDDCNNIVDDNPEDAPFWYADNDQDGFGSLTLLTKACEAPEGWIKTGGDCNDFDFLTNPNSLEYCDGYDNDCDELTDEPDAEDHKVFYQDLDGDGYGNVLEPIDACYLPDGYSESDEDCNDDPGGTGALQVPYTEEICQDGLDNNCNDSADQCSYDGWESVDDANYVMKGWGGGYLGYSLDGVGDNDGDGYDDLVAGAYFATVGGYTSGAGVLWYGEAEGTIPDREVDGKDAPLWGTTTSYDYFGRHSNALGDIDNDGYDDFGIGAYQWDYSSSYSGEGTMAIIYGKSRRYEEENIIEELETPGLRGPASSTYLGSTFGSAGDQNGDTYNDMLVGGYYHRHDGNIGSGGVWVVPGANTRYEHASDISGFGSFVGGERYTYLGYFGPTVDSGDLDGDGRPDMAMGAYGYNSYAGGSFVIYGTGGMPTGTQVVSDASDATFTGSTSYEYVGGYMTQIPGDINDDGYDDLMIGHYQASSYAGACYVVLGDSTQLRGGVAASKADVTIKGSGSSTYLCYGRPSLADFNNDGVAELVVSAYRQSSGSGTYNGATYLFEAGADFGNTAELTVTDDPLVEISGPSGSYAYFGYQTSTGDFNGDGYDDLVSSAYGAYGYGGGVYMFFGNSI